ncbi:hypothetical protein ACJX0J_037704, partial [Zea mays]
MALLEVSAKGDHLGWSQIDFFSEHAPISFFLCYDGPMYLVSPVQKRYILF